jgi:hypothetical protein
MWEGTSPFGDSRKFVCKAKNPDNLLLRTPLLLDGWPQPWQPLSSELQSWGHAAQC